MPKANEVATELRKLAAALEVEPDADIVKPNLYFTHFTDKPRFLALVALLPRPLKKEYDKNVSNGGGNLRIEYDAPGLYVDAYIQRSAICEIVEPAKEAVYHCPALLSDEEEATLTSAE